MCVPCPFIPSATPIRRTYVRKRLKRHARTGTNNRITGLKEALALGELLNRTVITPDVSRRLRIHLAS